MKSLQPAYNQLSKNIDLLEIELQNWIQLELNDVYGTVINYQKEQVDSIRLEIQDKLDTIKKEVDALQIEVMKPKIWYKESSVIVSLLAVMFSFGTAMASYFQIDSQNKRAARGELRGIIQRLIALPRENAENFDKYKSNRVVLSNLSSNINQEYILLASQAVELAERIPNDISGPEYISIAQALINQGIVAQVPILLNAGMKVTKDVNSELALLRNYGNYLFITGDVIGGRQKYQEAMNIFDKYPTNQYFVESSNAFTETAWANSEYSQGHCKQAAALLSSANSRVEKLPQGDVTDNLKGQVTFAQNYMKNNLRSCKP